MIDCAYCKMPFQESRRKKKFCCWLCKTKAFAASGPRFHAANNHRWKGGRHLRRGYVHLSNGKREHVVMAEAALGKPLPACAVVHHGLVKLWRAVFKA